MTLSSIQNVSSTPTRDNSRLDFSARPNSAAPRVEIANRAANGNSSSLSVGRGRDSVALSAPASALSTNDSINRVLADIVGSKASPTNGSSGAQALTVSATSAYNGGVEDPAARFRSDVKVPLEGYDQAKLDNPNHNTPKYIFGKVAQGFKLDSVQGDKAKAEELLKAMVPDLKARGLEVVSVEGDRIQVKTELGYEWVDVVRGAGSGNPGWWWGSEGKGTPQPTKDSKEWAAMTGQIGAAGIPSPASAFAPLGGGAGAPVGGPAKATPLGNQIDSAKVMAIVQKHPATNAGMRAAEPELKQAFPGVKILDHPVRLDKLQFANGAVVDVMIAAGDPSAKWGWMPEN